MEKFNAAFWKWFGQSEVVDAKGRPLVVYHGTFFDIKSFKPGNKPGHEEGVFFSTSKTASNYASFGSGEGGNVMPVYLSLQNPLVLNDPESGISRFAANYYDLAGKELQKQARSGGYDGIIIRARRKDRSVYVAFRPSQIKSAIGNDGSWDADDPDIRSNPSDVPDDIVEAAIAAREKAEESCGIRGQCFVASEILYDRLRKLGYDPALVAGWFVWGKERSDHTWLEVNGHVIDITADQFDKKFPHIWIDPPKKHYKGSHEYFFED